MHVLTKIFVVLVSLLAVLLVPLVVVYAYNEDSYKARYEAAVAQKALTSAQLAEAESRCEAQLSGLQVELDELRDEQARQEQAKVEAEAEVRRLQSDLATQQNFKAEIDTKLATLSSALKASQDLTGNLVTEVRTLRGDTLTLERQRADLDEALRDVSGQLEVAVQARRALQEELQRLKDELASKEQMLGDAIARGYQPGDVATGAMAGDGIAPNRDLTARVTDVIRGSEQTLVEIDAGSRDGIQKGWVMSLGRGATFKGKLRILTVDLNRATGVVSLESRERGLVERGDEAVARAGVK